MNFNKVKYEFKTFQVDENGNRKFIKIKPLKDIMSDLENYNNYLEKTIDDLEKEVNRLANYNKDEEIEKYKKQIEELEEQSVYILDKSQKEKMEKFRHEHYKITGHSYHEIILKPNEIFTKVIIKCPKCGEELDLTIY